LGELGGSVKRRTFLKGAAVAGAAVGIGFDMSRARAEMRQFKIARITETRSICPCCAVACGVIIHTLGDKAKNVAPTVVHVEGDPDNPLWYREVTGQQPRPRKSLQCLGVPP
jgi:formate dehydrogenase major subunit